MIQDYLEKLKENSVISDYYFTPLTDLGYDEEGNRLVIRTEAGYGTARVVEHLMNGKGFNMEYQECGYDVIEMGFE